VPAVEAASTVRRVTEPVLRALLGEDHARDAFDALRALPFTEAVRDGLLLHDVVRDTVGRELAVRDPDIRRAYRQRAARYYTARRPGGGAPAQHLRMQTFVITFRLDGMTDDEYRAFCDEIAPAFGELPGLVAKIWLTAPASGRYGGVYLFSDTSVADAFTESRIFRTVVFHPQFTDLAVQRFTVDEATTRRTQPGIGVVPTTAVTLWPTLPTRAG
jgi:hypothetical protein